MGAAEVEVEVMSVGDIVCVIGGRSGWGCCAGCGGRGVDGWLASLMIVSSVDYE